MCIIMKKHIVPLSNVLGEIPAFTLVAAVYGTQGKANGLDGLSIRYPDGTETIHTLPAGSRPWLRTVFPRYGERVEVGLDAEYCPFVFRFSTYQNTLVTRTHSRELCARVLDILS